MLPGIDVVDRPVETALRLRRLDPVQFVVGVILRPRRRQVVPDLLHVAVVRDRALRLTVGVAVPIEAVGKAHQRGAGRGRRQRDRLQAVVVAVGHRRAGSRWDCRATAACRGSPSAGRRAPHRSHRWRTSRRSGRVKRELFRGWLPADRSSVERC